MSSGDSQMIHVSDELHAEIKERCRLKGEFLRHWTEATLQAALDAERLEEKRKVVAPPPVEVSLSELRAKLRPAVRPPREVRKVSPPEDPRDPWTRPPFWKAPGYTPPAPGLPRRREEATEAVPHDAEWH